MKMNTLLFASLAYIIYSATNPIATTIAIIGAISLAIAVKLERGQS